MSKKKEEPETPEEVLYRLCDKIEDFADKCVENHLKPEEPGTNAFLTLRISDLLVVRRVLDEYLAIFEAKQQLAKETVVQDEVAKPQV